MGNGLYMLRKQLPRYQKFRKLSKENPASIIQPIAEKIQMDTEADFIVVGNKEGIRYAHPERDKIGEKWLAEIIKAFY